MKSKKFLLLVFTLLFISPVAFCQTIEEYSFKNYPASKSGNKVKAKINYASNETARYFKTRIAEGYKSGDVDFAGNYITVMWGCGTGCVSGAMVDVRDGKVYNLPLGEEYAYAGCYNDNNVEEITFKPDSKLFITTSCSSNVNEETHKDTQSIVYYVNVWDEPKKKFVLLKKLNKKLVVEARN